MMIKGWKRRFFIFLLALFICAIFGFVQLSAALRPITDNTNSWVNERRVFHDDNFLGPYSAWNITGTYKGTWNFMETANRSSRPDFLKSAGVAMIEILTTTTKIRGVHYLHGGILFHDMSVNEHDMGVAHLRVEGVYIWPFRQIRLVANSVTDGEWVKEEENLFTNPYHLLGAFSSQVFQESTRDKLKRRKNSLTLGMEKHCNLDISAHVSRVSHNLNEIHQRYHLEGLIESPSIDDDGECLPPIQLNVSSVNIDVYYNKAINYTLMVTFVSVLQVLLLIRQMEHSNTQSGAAKVSIITIGQQAIIDAYLCLLHLTAGILVVMQNSLSEVFDVLTTPLDCSPTILCSPRTESLFNAFATAAFFKFVVFSIFEMRYILAIWKACRPSNNGEGWDTLRRELSILYSRFYGILLGGILIMYELHDFLQPILLFMHSFWIPQIISNVIHDRRKPLHPHYILGMTVTRLTIPFYVFGCPNNFMRINPDQNWCIYLGVFMFIQAVILLLQHYLGSRCFIPHQILPNKYSYYRRFENDSSNGIDCVICMTPIDLSQRSNDCMITPCEHFFHSGCLQRWMDIKMECPTCRRPLPPA